MLRTCTPAWWSPLNGVRAAPHPAAWAAAGSRAAVHIDTPWLVAAGGTPPDGGRISLGERLVGGTSLPGSALR